MTNVNSYLKFLAKLQINKTYLELSATETQLLHAVAKAQYNDKVTQVKDLLVLREIASQATLHGALKKLIKKKLLISKADQTDGRVKNIQLTKLGHKYFSDLSNSLVFAASK